MRAALAGSVHVLTSLTRRVRPDGTLLDHPDEYALQGVIRDLERVLAASRMRGVSVNVRGAGDVVRALDGLAPVGLTPVGLAELAPAGMDAGTTHLEVLLDAEVAHEEARKAALR